MTYSESQNKCERLSNWQAWTSYRLPRPCAIPEGAVRLAIHLFQSRSPWPPLLPLRIIFYTIQTSPSCRRIEPNRGQGRIIQNRGSPAFNPAQPSGRSSWLTILGESSLVSAAHRFKNLGYSAEAGLLTEPHRVTAGLIDIQTSRKHSQAHVERVSWPVSTDTAHATSVNKSLQSRVTLSFPHLLPPR